MHNIQGSKLDVASFNDTRNRYHVTRTCRRTTIALIGPRRAASCSAVDPSERHILGSALPCRSASRSS